MQAGGDYLDDARASGALGIQARVWQPLRLPRAGGTSKILVGTRLSGGNNLSPQIGLNLSKYGDDQSPLSSYVPAAFRLLCVIRVHNSSFELFQCHWPQDDYKAKTFSFAP